MVDSDLNLLCKSRELNMSDDDVIKVFVGADRSQQMAVKVLEYSIKRHTTALVEVIPMVDLSVPLPVNPRNWQRTGFSYSRFCIPKLVGYSGRAIYMDADMLVFKDIRGLWELPFHRAKVVVQQEVKHLDATMGKENAPQKRIKQCAVMLLDCSSLDWDIDTIVNDMDKGCYTYEQLMYEMCILDEDKVDYSIPFEWNSLEYFDEATCLIHYTDMGTQPWVSTKNSNGHLWFDEVRRMLADGSMNWKALEEEVALGYFRPSLLREIRYGHRLPKFLCCLFNYINEVTDRLNGYIPHKSVYETKRIRSRAVEKYERIKSSTQASF